MHRHDNEPGIIAWLVAVVSLALPWVGIGCAVAGTAALGRHGPVGWWLIGAGVIMVVADIVIDFVWAHPTVSRSDQPDLNRRTAQLIGQVLVVEQPIEGGRGKVRVGDTLWQAEGPDAPAGAEVTVTAAKGTVLVVQRL